MLTRITDRKIPCVFIHVCCLTKIWGPDPYNSLRHADNFSALSVTRNRREAQMFYLAREIRKFGYVLAEKKVTLSWLMNSNMVKPKKFDHLLLVYNFSFKAAKCSSEAFSVFYVFVVSYRYLRFWECFFFICFILHVCCFGR